MKEMRDVVRTDDMDAALAALLPRLEKAVLDSEQRRETRVDQISTALTSLVAQLQKLPLPREVARPLKTFAKQLDGRVGQAREIPLLLSELSSLQGQALDNLEPDGETPRPGPGLLQRLFGGKDVTNEAAVASEPPPSPAAQPVAVKPAAEPAEPEQSQELTQALRAFSPQPQEPVAPRHEAAAPSA
jgi:diguanylate cyclase